MTVRGIALYLKPYWDLIKHVSNDIRRTNTDEGVDGSSISRKKTTRRNTKQSTPQGSSITYQCD
jgi:hypothetical protein